MRSIYLLLTIYTCVLCTGKTFTQELDIVNSLLRKLSNAKNDTNKINLLQDIAFEYENSDLDKALEFYTRAEKLALTIKATKKLPSIYSNKGIVYQYAQEYDSSAYYFNEGIRVAEKLKDTLSLAKLTVNLGNTYFHNDKLKEAIVTFKKALIYAKRVDFHAVVGGCYRGIGNCYDKLKKYEFCEKYHKMAMEFDKGHHLDYNLAQDYANLGTLYIDQKRYKEAILYLNQSTDLLLTIGYNGDDLATNYNNLGSVYYEEEKYEQALEWFKKAKEQYQRSKAQENIPFANKNIASTLLALDQVDLAKIYLDSAMHHFTYKNQPHIAIDASLILAEIYMKQNKHEQAAKLLLTLYDIKDSVEQSYQKDLLSEMELKFQTKEKDLKLQKSAKDLKIKQAESDRRSVFIVSLAGVGILLLILFFNVRKANAKITKANGLIESQNEELIHQKRLVEDSNQSLISSIRYAQNLQNAILPSKESMALIFPKHLSIYLPKDIVAGDFYWLETMNDLVFFAVADCTGHGVPGAMVSVVCYNALNQALRDYQLTDPAAILEQARTLVIKTFEKNSVNIKDGMDIALCSYNSKTKILKFAGANNSVLIYHNKQMVKLHASRQSIGFSENEIRFETYDFQLATGDRLYAFSDGFADQFGGPQDKKYKSKNLENFILSIQDHSMETQEELLLTQFSSWKGNGEQTDDVSVLGVEFH